MVVAEEQVDLATPSGPMRVYVYQPTSPPGAERRKLPGIALYSEIYQQTGPIKRSALRLAAEGYLVAVPEVFHEHEPLGTVLPYDPTGTDKGNRYKYATKLGTYDRDARVVLDHLRDHPRSTGQLGAIGFCLGGHLAFRAAPHRDVLATACFYATDLHSDTLGEGKQSDSLSRMSEVAGELMMVWGRQDPHIPDEGRATVHDALRAAGTTFSWHELNAVHAFMRDEGPRYDPSLAALGWALALELFRRRLA